MTQSTTTGETSDKSGLIRKAYSAATAKVRDAHRDEFNAFMVEEAKALGVDWKPKQTDEEKAAAKLQAILAEHPHLREQMGLPPEAGETA
jgi:hypothetical protein